MLFQRVITAICLVFLILVILIFSDKNIWMIFSVLLTLLVMREYTRIVKIPSHWSMVYLLLSLVLLLVVLFYDVIDLIRQVPYLSSFLGFLLLLYWLLLVPFILNKKIKLKNTALACIFGWVMFVPFGSYIAELFANKTTTGILSLTQVNLIILYLVLLVWVADISAYFVGKQIGQRKLAPEISPGKSMEGVIGAIIMVVLYSAAYYVLLSNQLSQIFSWSVLFIWLLCSLPLTCISVIGDLFESWLKRCACVKDSSKLLPGHGGIYDRVDSLVAVLSMYPIINLILNHS